MSGLKLDVQGDVAKVIKANEALRTKLLQASARALVRRLERKQRRPTPPEPLEVRLAKIFHDGQVRVNAIVDNANRKLDALALEFVPKMVRPVEVARLRVSREAMSSLANQMASYDYENARAAAMQNAYGTPCPYQARQLSAAGYASGGAIGSIGRGLWW